MKGFLVIIKEFDKYPKTKDFLNYASVHGYAYNKLKQNTLN